MWVRVTADDEAVLGEYTTVLRELEPLQRMYSFGSLLAQTRSSVAHERIFLFHYPGSGFDLFLRIQHEPRLNQYLLCPGLCGAIELSAALQLMIEKGLEFGREQGVEQLFAIEPKGTLTPPLAELFRLMHGHPGIDLEVEASLVDCTILRFAVPTVATGPVID